jgi:hypothetical protein
MKSTEVLNQVRALLGVKLQKFNFAQVNYRSLISLKQNSIMVQL